jgi:hypothetical protein
MVAGERTLPMRIADPFLNDLIPRAYFGGGAPKAPKPPKIPKPKPMVMPAPPPMPKFEMPKMPKTSTAAEIAAAMPKPIPPTPIPPPATTSPLEAQEVAAEELRKQGRRRGYAASIIAGEQPQEYASTATPPGSLLG